MRSERQISKDLMSVVTEIRAKLSELDLVNAEHAQKEKVYWATRREYDALSDKLDALNMEMQPTHRQLVEIRSEIQAMQMRQLDLLVEWFQDIAKP